MFEQKGKILVCGNGGSASDSLHMVGEIVGRFQKERKGWAAIALNSDVATMTAIANDYLKSLINAGLEIPRDYYNNKEKRIKNVII